MDSWTKQPSSVSVSYSYFSGVLSRRGPQLGVAFVGVSAFLFSIASVLLLKRYGRRQVLVFGFGALAVIAWLFGFSFGAKDSVLI